MKLSFSPWQYLCLSALLCFSCGTTVRSNKAISDKTRCDTLNGLNNVKLRTISPAQIAALRECSDSSYAMVSDGDLDRVQKLYPDITIEKADQLFATLNTYDTTCEYNNKGGRVSGGIVPDYADAAKFAY